LKSLSIHHEIAPIISIFGRRSRVWTKSAKTQFIRRDRQIKQEKK